MYAKAFNMLLLFEQEGMAQLGVELPEKEQ